ncbi:cytochrome c maturation protein CcmE [Oceanihabitans sp. IOP_32]|uniref:hypothetical protein n=1 Tax=Oceanihabitans sp. IOP_32 TaxID=2529032 RepID=UPI001293F39F|nr:hypothetical protein [Oceanihabitans sp. IOP_32]QFZ55041.1 cytochrome c maturation protein CcmE [Oceanihabitans sp. IOP_32]
MKAFKNNLMVLFVVLSTATIAQNAPTKEDDSNIEITKISDLKKYTSSYIQGSVIKITDVDEFRIQDSSKTIKVYTGWRNTNLVKTGQNIIVKGVLDPGFFFDEFYASEIILENGELINLAPD